MKYLFAILFSILLLSGCSTGCLLKKSFEDKSSEFSLEEEDIKALIKEIIENYKIYKDLFQAAKINLQQKPEKHFPYNYVFKQIGLDLKKA